MLNSSVLIELISKSNSKLLNFYDGKETLWIEMKAANEVHKLMEGTENEQGAAT